MKVVKAKPRALSTPETQVHANGEKSHRSCGKPDNTPAPQSWKAPEAGYAGEDFAQPLSLLAAALGYGQRGWPVLPVHYGHDNRIRSFKGIGFNDATTDPEAIRILFSQRKI